MIIAIIIIIIVIIIKWSFPSTKVITIGLCIILKFSKFLDFFIQLDFYIPSYPCLSYQLIKFYCTIIYFLIIFNYITIVIALIINPYLLVNFPSIKYFIKSITLNFFSTVHWFFNSFIIILSQNSWFDFKSN